MWNYLCFCCCCVVALLLLIIIIIIFCASFSISMLLLPFFPPPSFFYSLLLLHYYYHQSTLLVLLLGELWVIRPSIPAERCARQKPLHETFVSAYNTRYVYANGAAVVTDMGVAKLGGKGFNLKVMAAAFDKEGFQPVPPALCVQHSCICDTCARFQG